MKKANLFRITSFIALTLAFSCKPSIDIPRASPGNADFSQYLAIGNSLTAGYADGGLYLEGQQVAFPNLIAEQMKAAGGGPFTSPLFDAAQANGSGYLSLKAINNGLPVLEEVVTNLAYRDNEGHLAKYLASVQNIGVPGMRLDLAYFEPFSAFNNFFERLLPDEAVGTTTYFNYANTQEYTFFSFWLGNNDALGFATAGGVVTPSNAATTELTDKATFSALYTRFVAALTENGKKGVLATIPDVTSIPFFTTVTIDNLLLQAKAIGGAQAPEAIFIQDKTAVLPGLPKGVRAANAEDLVVMNFATSGLFGQLNAANLPYGLHPENPIEDQYILDKTEVAHVKDYVSSYNTTIKTLAESHQLALADAFTYLNQVKNGLTINGITLNSDFITGGIFSLDGVHLTPRGNALMANLFIREINKTYEANLPEVNVSGYRGVKLP